MYHAKETSIYLQTLSHLAYTKNEKQLVKGPNNLIQPFTSYYDEI